MIALQKRTIAINVLHFETLQTHLHNASQQQLLTMAFEIVTTAEPALIPFALGSQ